MIKEYHKILNLPENADKEEIKKAYRRLAKKFHPDINKSSDAHETFLELSEAYEFLINAPHVSYSKQTDTKTSQDKEETYKSWNADSYEFTRNKARERAEKQARMRYEQFKKQHEAFQESGLYDIGLIPNFIGNIILFLFAVGCIIYPPIGMFKVVSRTHEWSLLILTIFPLIIGSFIMIYIFQKRKTYFKIGKFYYKIGDVKKIFKEKRSSNQKCYYSVNQPANSISFELELLKVKDIKLKTAGPLQHNIKHKNVYEKVKIPRSLKAVRIHTINTIIKILSIVLCLFILKFDSELWRMIAGMFVGGIIAQIILLLFKTKSNTSYLVSPFFLMKLITWIMVIYLVSDIQIQSGNIKTQPYIQIVIIGILLLDSFLEQLLKMLFGKMLLKPIIKQHIKIDEKFENGYQLYNEIPIWTVVYPICKWIFG